jgi:uncharacterized membrane protein YdfJ with MMPL/SSD domain
MFSTLAELVSKYRIYVTVFWISLALALFFAAPKLSEVGVTDESQFLPQDTESAHARDLLKEKFVTMAEVPASSGTIVIYKAQGLTEQDIQATKAIRDWLVSPARPEVVSQVISIFDSEALRSTLLSADNTTLLMVVEFSVPPLDDIAKEAVGQIREFLHGQPGDVSLYFTGEVGFFQDLFQSIIQTIDRTTFVTIALVAVLLLIVYRSPVAALLPLITIGCSFLAARGVLGYMGAAGVEISTLADAYLVVTIFGVGTDYCLFIVSRFREELALKDRGEAGIHSLTRIGPVITASAVTVIVAFLSLGISRFGMTRTIGIALALGVAVTLIAGLTLVPALMSLFGKYLFWPAKTFAPRREGSFGWSRIGQWIVRRPIVVAVPIIVVLLLPYIALPHLTRSADVLSQMPQNVESVQGFRVMVQHFRAGEFSPLYLLIESPQGEITDPGSLQALGQIAGSLKGTPGVARVEYSSAPSSQLTGLALQMQSMGDQLGEGTVDPGLVASLQNAGQLLPKLALQYSGVVSSQNFQQAGASLSQISTLVSQIYTTPPASLPALLAQLQELTYGLADSLQGLASEFNLVGDTPFVSWLRSAYFSRDMTIARVNIVLEGDPYSESAMATVRHLRDAAAESVSATSLQGASLSIGGETATHADIMLTNDADFGRVTGLTTAGILVVIIILLRSLLAPLYMVATVLLNYGATLGIATWLVLDVLKHNSMIYMIPIFLFVILVALGADYNIFLVSRIREEAEQRSIKEAVARAVANTGGVITACGIILAGTFATLMTSSLQVVFQMGAAIAIGVLIDTFIVRALLVPCLAALAGRWSWWPSRLFRRLSK